MNRSFVLTPTAEEDAISIWRYVSDEAGERTADRVLRRLYAECEKLGENPGMGHWREDLLDKNYRFWSVWSYLIVYHCRRKPIQVIAFVHGARDLSVFFPMRFGDQSS